mmetsp:Transcript_29444/g.77427  ORF Transcript_29444/g.77427 Transcript_29444/m.77427 type:complete len:269 (-) Transcript_29444:2654-3460(-)
MGQAKHESRQLSFPLLPVRLLPSLRGKQNEPRPHWPSWLLPWPLCTRLERLQELREPPRWPWENQQLRGPEWPRRGAFEEQHHHQQRTRRLRAAPEAPRGQPQPAVLAQRLQSQPPQLRRALPQAFPRFSFAPLGLVRRLPVSALPTVLPTKLCCRSVHWRPPCVHPRPVSPARHRAPRARNRARWRLPSTRPPSLLLPPPHAPVPPLPPPELAARARSVSAATSPATPPTKSRANHAGPNGPYDRGGSMAGLLLAPLPQFLGYLPLR